MNVYEAMRYIRTQVTKRNSNSEMWSSLDEIERVANAYDALAPDWSRFSDDVQWYTIDTDGNAMVSDVEPEIEHTEWLVDIDFVWREAGVVQLPLGIDWRLCKWSREGAK